MNAHDVPHAVDQLWLLFDSNVWEGAATVVTNEGDRHLLPLEPPNAFGNGSAERGPAERGPSPDPAAWLRIERLLLGSCRGRIDAVLSDHSANTEQHADSTPVYSPWNSGPRPAPTVLRTACAWAFACRFWLDVYQSDDFGEVEASYATDRLRRIPLQLAVVTRLLRASVTLEGVDSALASWLEGKVDDLKRRIAWLQLPADPPAWKLDAPPASPRDTSEPAVTVRASIERHLQSHGLSTDRLSGYAATRKAA